MRRRERPNADPSESPLVSHLIELRDRLLRIVGTVLGLFLSMIYFANDLYEYLAAPLMAHLPADTSMIATEVASPFFTPFKLTLVLSIFLAMPMMLYQFWCFIAPGLYRKEKKMIFPLLASSTFLFYLGGVFAYFVVFPLVFGFFTSVAPEGVAIMTDISHYLDFVLKMFFAFGLAFEIPIAVVVLVWAGIASTATLKEKRPYIIVGVFVLAMLLTPPDAISQTLLALPMIILFEAGLFFARRFENREEEEDELDEELHRPDSEVETSENDNGTKERDELDEEFMRAQINESSMNENNKDNPRDGS